jgi:organic hydroperoxide reductase OsmC/OhrA
MKPLPHNYNVHLTGGPSGYAGLSTPGIPDLRTAPPADYDGPGDAWSPEHLLLAAVQTCFLFTLRSIARASRVDFVSLELDAAGTVDRQGGVTRFTEIVLPTARSRPGNRSGARAAHPREEREAVSGIGLALHAHSPGAGDHGALSLTLPDSLTPQWRTALRP